MEAPSVEALFPFLPRFSQSNSNHSYIAVGGEGGGRGEGDCVGELELSDDDETKSPAKIDPFYNVSAAIHSLFAPLARSLFKIQG